METLHYKMVVLWNFFEIEQKRFLTCTTIYNHNLEIADELSVFDHFVGLAFKGLTCLNQGPQRVTKSGKAKMLLCKRLCTHNIHDRTPPT